MCNLIREKKVKQFPEAAGRCSLTNVAQTGLFVGDYFQLRLAS